MIAAKSGTENPDPPGTDPKPALKLVPGGLAVRIHSAYLEGLEPSSDELLSQLRSPLLSGPEKDRLWLGLVMSYRAEPRRWSALLLEALAPSLTELARKLAPVQPVLDGEDVGQQLVLEALLAASRLPFKQQRFVEEQLLGRVRTKLLRWLKHEIEGRDWIDPSVRVEEPW